MPEFDVSESSIPVAAEDRYLIFSFGKGHLLCPHINHAIHLGEMVYQLRQDLDQVIPIFDLRGLEGYYNDIDNFIRCVGGDQSYVILGKDECDVGWEEMLEEQGLTPILAKGDNLGKHFLNVEYFDCELEAYDHAFDTAIQYQELSYNDAMEARSDAQFNDLKDFILKIHRHSLLTEFTMSINGEKIQVIPYHSHAIHEVETIPSKVIIGRPGIIANTTGAVFSDEIREFETLINSNDAKELRIQRFLESHPNFLKGLNYENIYPQIILERDDDGSLRPDFILEPYDDAFCDILDIKLPTQKIFTGRKDRATLAAGLHEVGAQLREYASYFEQEKYRKLVREKYGLRVYKPRLIAIVGRDMKQMTEPQFRRALTVYDNLQFMTFDELLQHAKRRILI
jgi:Domain of unknown function (DUF4263)